MQLHKILFGLLLVIGFFGCQSKQQKKEYISFKPIFGISYTEVSRRTEDGLSFNEYGYQLEPNWQLTFVSDDSVRLYSLIKKQFLNFPLSRGYDSVFNTARTWLKARTLTKDSLYLELIMQKGDSLDIRGAKVYMTFYANDYIKNVLHTTAEILQRPGKKDTLFVRSLVAAANKDHKKAFAGRQPVVLTSKSAQVKVERVKTEATIFNMYSPDDYLTPAFNITINKAHIDFNYSFTVFVDEKGKMHFGIPLIGFIHKQYEGPYIHSATAVMEGYLKYYLNVIPGETLGMPHASEISLNVTGKKAI